MRWARKCASPTAESKRPVALCSASRCSAGQRSPVGERFRRDAVEREVREARLVVLAVDEREHRLVVTGRVACEVDVEEPLQRGERLARLRVDARAQVVELDHLLIQCVVDLVVEADDQHLPDREDRDDRREREQDDVRGEDPRPGAVGGVGPATGRPRLFGLSSPARWRECSLPADAAPRPDRPARPEPVLQLRPFALPRLPPRFRRG